MTSPPLWFGLLAGMVVPAVLAHLHVRVEAVATAASIALRTADALFAERFLALVAFDAALVAESYLATRARSLGQTSGA